MAFLPGPLSDSICYRYLHNLELLLRQAQEKDGNPGH